MIPRRSRSWGTRSRVVHAAGDSNGGFTSRRWVLFAAAVALALGVSCGQTESDPGAGQGSGGLTQAGADGGEGCPCYGYGTCAPGLTCVSDRCVLRPGYGAGGGAGEGGEGGVDAAVAEGGSPSERVATGGQA